MCSVCEEGGFLSKMSTYLSQIKEQFGFELEKEIVDVDVQKDLKGFNVEQARKGLKKKKDEL